MRCNAWQILIKHVKFAEQVYNVSSRIRYLASRTDRDLSTRISRFFGRLPLEIRQFPRRKPALIHLQSRPTGTTTALSGWRDAGSIWNPCDWPVRKQLKPATVTNVRRLQWLSAQHRAPDILDAFRRLLAVTTPARSPNRCSRTHDKTAEIPRSQHHRLQT